jgi:DNA-binding transcriptional ArsR family regulator
MLAVSTRPDIAHPAVMKALSHPLRARILGVLEERQASPVELARMLDRPVENVSYHVHLLAQLGLVKLVRETRVRGAIEHHYEATMRPVVNDRDWAALPKLVKRSGAAAVIERLGEDMVAAVPAGGFDGAGTHVSRTELALDARAWDELGAALEQVLTKALRLEAEAARRARRTQDRAGLVSATLGVLLFERRGPVGPGL